MNARVKRAVAATLDVLLRSRDDDDAAARASLEDAAVASLEGDQERLDYEVGVSHLYERAATKRAE